MNNLPGGKAWWWNNYDIFLILFAGLIINIILLFASKYFTLKIKRFTGTIIMLAFIVITIQVNTRQVDYAYTGNTNKYNTFEEQSKKEQERILGHWLCRKMEKLDRIVPVNF